MSLINGSLQIGQSAIRASQAALQVIGNNIANASDPDYARQKPIVAPIALGDVTGGQSGMGVRMAGVQRIVDEAINARLRAALSQRAAAEAAADQLAQLETVLNGLGQDNLSVRLTTFFNAWGELAADPQSAARRSLLLQAADGLTRAFQAHSNALTAQEVHITSQLGQLGAEANQLIRQVASLNEQIMQAEQGSVQNNAGALRDQRDAALGRLAELMEIRTLPSGSAVNVYLGSMPLVLSANPFTLEWSGQSGASGSDATFRIASVGATAPISGGKIGGLLAVRDGVLGQVREGLDQLAQALIQQVNQLHAEGQGLVGAEALSATNAVSSSSAALDAAGLSLTPGTGSFNLHVTRSDGMRTAHRIQIDLDGPGAKTTLDGLAAAIDGLEGVSATVINGLLTIQADDGCSIQFSQDTSHVLAALGINTFFTGIGAGDIAVRSDLSTDRIAAALSFMPGDAANAIRLADLAETGLASLGGLTPAEFHRYLVTDMANQGADASREFESADALAETLSSQRQAISGVSVDEEAIALIKYQQMFQGAARYIALISELLQEVNRLI